MAYALQKDGKTVAEHSTYEACLIEAIERKWVFKLHADFIGDKEGTMVLKGIEIVEVNPTVGK